MGLEDQILIAVVLDSSWEIHAGFHILSNL